jgi:SAM-dependent methyltransferase
VGWCEAFFVAVRVRLYHLRETVVNFFLYYLRHPVFLAADFLAVGQYFFRSPFRIVRLYDEAHPDHPIGPYGESDFRTLSFLFSSFDIPSTASVADLGSGRGRTGLFLRLVRGHKRVVGVEFLPLMAQRSERVRRWLHIDGLSFIQGDWADVPQDGIDVVYLYGLILDEEVSMRVAKRLSSLKPGTKIITVSSWFGETLPERFRLVRTIPVRFDWGRTDAFLQTVK